MRVVLACLLFAGVALAIPAEESGYTTQYDNLDIDEILTNDRLYQKYFQCLTGKSKCTPDGKKLKEIIPDALKTKCSKCNKKQQAGMEKVLKHMLENRRADFDELQKIFDPSGEYLEKYKEEAAKRGINL